MLDSESEDEGDDHVYDYKNALGNNLQDFLSKIELHVKAEQKILDAWNEKDEAINKKK